MSEPVADRYEDCGWEFHGAAGSTWRPDTCLRCGGRNWQSGETEKDDDADGDAWRE